MRPEKYPLLKKVQKEEPISIKAICLISTKEVTNKTNDEKADSYIDTRHFIINGLKVFANDLEKKIDKN